MLTTKSLLIIFDNSEYSPDYTAKTINFTRSICEPDRILNSVRFFPYSGLCNQSKTTKGQIKFFEKLLLCVVGNYSM